MGSGQEADQYWAGIGQQYWPISPSETRLIAPVATSLVVIKGYPVAGAVPGAEAVPGEGAVPGGGGCPR
ncbi:MAG: hypothetical protein LBG27_01835 [Spirochaetaceae bacterium]|nr:hypothetical protein [Spirochaetaceae bacterium]